MSTGVPTIPNMSDIRDLFANFGHNWSTLSPALWVLFGIIFGTFVLGKIIKNVKGDD